MIYLDACILIYAVEDTSERGDRVRYALRQADVPVAVSPLVIHECLVGPLRTNDLELRDRYNAVFERLHQLPLDAEAFIRAAELRAAFRVKTPDALHLAAAQIAGCDALWTNDKRLAQASRGLAVDILGEGVAGLPTE